MPNPMQNKLLEMLSWLTAFIGSNGLRYYALGGTLLGAIRHQGFIPWDDDIDIGMPRSDYNKLCTLLSVPHSHYIVESPNSDARDYIYPFAKFYDLDTTLTELQKIKITRGVYIDIFPLDGVGNSLEESIINFKKYDRINMLLAMRTCIYRKERTAWKNAAAIFGNLIPINRKYLARTLNKLCSTYDYDKCVYVANCVGGYRLREILDKQILGNPTPYKFEGLTVFGPEHYEEYLTHIYGDWRKLPPDNRRYAVHDLVNLDLEKPFRIAENRKGSE